MTYINETGDDLHQVEAPHTASSRAWLGLLYMVLDLLSSGVGALSHLGALQAPPGPLWSLFPLAGLAVFQGLRLDNGTLCSLVLYPSRRLQALHRDPLVHCSHWRD